MIVAALLGVIGHWYTHDFYLSKLHTHTKKKKKSMRGCKRVGKFHLRNYDRRNNQIDIFILSLSLAPICGSFSSFLSLTLLLLWRLLLPPATTASVLMLVQGVHTDLLSTAQNKMSNERESRIKDMER